MGWIKAERRMPISQIDYFIRYQYGDGSYEKEVGKKENILDLVENGWLNVEWLEEDNASQTLYTEKDIKNISQWIALEGFSFNKETEMWYEHITGPRYTWEQLLKLYLNTRIRTI